MSFQAPYCQPETLKPISPAPQEVDAVASTVFPSLFPCCPGAPWLEPPCTPCSSWNKRDPQVFQLLAWARPSPCRAFPQDSPGNLDSSLRLRLKISSLPEHPGVGGGSAPLPSPHRVRFVFTVSPYPHLTQNQVNIFFPSIQSSLAAQGLRKADRLSQAPPQGLPNGMLLLSAQAMVRKL